MIHNSTLGEPHEAPRTVLALVGVEDAVEHVEAVPAEVGVPGVGEACAVDHFEDHHAGLFIVMEHVVFDLCVDVMHWEQFPFGLVSVDDGHVDGPLFAPDPFGTYCLVSALFGLKTIGVLRSAD